MLTMNTDVFEIDI